MKPKHQIARFAMTSALFAACGGQAPSNRSTAADTGAATASRVTRDSAAGTTGAAKMDSMPGMDHGRMMPPAATTPVPAQKGTMPGMDHSKMSPVPRASQPPAAPSSMPAMDHAKMSSMPRDAQPAASPGMPRMRGMPEMPNVLPADESTKKILRMLARLVADSVVQARIQADSVLRNRWRDTTVRRILLPPR